MILQIIKKFKKQQKLLFVVPKENLREVFPLNITKDLLMHISNLKPKPGPQFVRLNIMESLLMIIKKMATILNNYFGSIFTIPDGGSIPLPDAKVFGSSISNISFTKKDLKKKIMNLKTSSSTGPDKISSKFLQTFANEVSVH